MQPVRSGAAAVRQGYLAVASGAHDTVLAVGVEKMTGVDRSQITDLLASAADVDREVANGANFAALNALLMRRYMYEHNVTREDFASFSLVAHQNATVNPNARLRAGLTREEYLHSRIVADPVAVHDASPIADGAAAVVMRPSTETAGHKNTEIVGSASATDSLSLQVRDDPLHFTAIEKSAREAMHQANTTTDDIDFVEFHDAFTITTVLSLEACGFASRGKATEFVRQWGIDRDTGRLPISTFGGLKARGHPVGATGTYQVVEAVLQLRGEAGANQISSPTVAMTQSLGGNGSTAITHILRRPDVTDVQASG